MRYSAEIEAKIIAQIEAEPDREVILPDWAYWKGVDTPWVYIEGLPKPLVHVLYERVIGVIPDRAGLTPRPGTDRRNVNPHLWLLMPYAKDRIARPVCPNGHEYTDADWKPGVGHRCQACRALKLLGTPNAADLNKAKTHCPAGHPLKGKNLINLKNGRRKCRICHADTQARYAARKRKKS